MHHFGVLGNGSGGKFIQQSKNLGPISNETASQFPDDKRMAQNFAVFQKFAQFIIAVPEMVYPNRRINERHGGLPHVCGERSSVSSQYLPDPPDAERFHAR
jgi:hypothetical protein